MASVALHKEQLEALHKVELDLATADTDVAGSSGADVAGSSGVSSQSTEWDSESAVRRALVIRHGETDFNADGRIQGVLESQLTDAGRSQARVVGAWLAATDDIVDRVVVSPKERTMQTLDEIEAECAKVGVALPAREPRFDLREIELTPWQGMKKPEIKAQDNAAWEAWKNTPCEFVFATGHAPLQDLYARAGAEWDNLHATPPGTTTLVVAHGAFNRVFLAQALGLPIEAFQDDAFDFCNCECVELEWSEGERSFRWRRRHPTLTPWTTVDEEQARFAALQERPIVSSQYDDPGSSKGA